MYIITANNKFLIFVSAKDVNHLLYKKYTIKLSWFIEYCIHILLTFKSNCSLVCKWQIVHKYSIQTWGNFYLLMNPLGLSNASEPRTIHTLCSLNKYQFYS